MQRIGGHDAVLEAQHPKHFQRACGLVAAGRLEKAMSTVMSDSRIRERLARLDITPDFAPAQVLRTTLENEIKNWTKFIDAKGIKPE
jgi:hypothetical protein